MLRNEAVERVIKTLKSGLKTKDPKEKDQVIGSVCEMLIGEKKLLRKRSGRRAHFTN